jgi:hypothetical protein
MSKRNDEIVKWAVNKIETEYKNDVSLFLVYGSYENGTANQMSDVDFYYIPKTERASELCKSFIVEGIGYDLFPMTWERVAGLAELEESITPCLANVKILFCNQEEDRIRFEGLQHRLKSNLNNKLFMLEKALDRLDTVMYEYRTMLFEEDICLLRTIAGKIIMLLSEAVAYANQTYFSRGLKKQLEDLKNMESVPQDYVLLYEKIIKAKSDQEMKQVCYQIIKNTKIFIDGMVKIQEAHSQTINYNDLAEFYKEAISAWNKISVTCENGDAVLAYISGACLQNELNSISREYNLKKFDLMSSFHADNLKLFNENAIAIQDSFVELIEKGGVIITKYNSVEDFIKVN